MINHQDVPQVVVEYNTTMNNITPLTKTELEHETLCVFVTRGFGLSAHCTIESHFPPAGQDHVHGHLTRSQLCCLAQEQHQQLVDRGDLLEVRVVAEWAERCAVNGVRLS